MHFVTVSAVAAVSVDAQLAESSVDRIVSQWREVSADEQSQLREQIDEILRPLDLQTRLVVMQRAGVSESHYEKSLQFQSSGKSSSSNVD